MDGERESVGVERVLSPMRTLAAVLGLVFVVSCSGLTDTEKNMGSVPVSFSVGPDVATVTLEVTGEGIPVTLVFNFELIGGTAGGTIKVPAGLARTFLVQGFDASNVVTHEGSATIEVTRGGNPTLLILVFGVGGDVTVSIITDPVLNIAVDPILIFEIGVVSFPELTLNGDVIPSSDAEWSTEFPAILEALNGSGEMLGVSVGTSKLFATVGVIQTSTTVNVQLNVLTIPETGIQMTAGVSRDFPNLLVNGVLVSFDVAVWTTADASIVSVDNTTGRMTATGTLDEFVDITATLGVSSVTFSVLIS